QGIDLGIADPIAHVQNLGGKIPNARPSMLLDSLAGRHGEIDAINGAISRLGAELGVSTPTNDVVVAIVKAKESLISVLITAGSRPEFQGTTDYPCSFDIVHRSALRVPVLWRPHLSA